jgi:hypothetical protein
MLMNDIYKSSFTIGWIVFYYYGPFSAIMFGEKYPELVFQWGAALSAPSDSDKDGSANTKSRLEKQKEERSA